MMPYNCTKIEKKNDLLSKNIDNAKETNKIKTAQK